MPHTQLLIGAQTELSCSTNAFLPPNSLSISTLGLISPLWSFFLHLMTSLETFMTPGLLFQVAGGFKCSWAWHSAVHLWLFYGSAVGPSLHGRCLGGGSPRATVWILMFLCGQLQNGHVSTVKETITGRIYGWRMGWVCNGPLLRKKPCINHLAFSQGFSIDQELCFAF